MAIWGIERGKNKRRFVVALTDKDQKRDKKTLYPLIQKYIKAGSILYSDSWASYLEVEKELGYKHYIINHKKNYVDPEYKHIHTQTIERFWRTLKRWIKRSGIRVQYVHQDLS